MLTYCYHYLVAVWAQLPWVFRLPRCRVAVAAGSRVILCIIWWRQAANRVRIVLVAWLVGPDAAAYLCYDLAYNYHLAGGELVAWNAVLLTMCPRGDLLWPGVVVFGLGCLFALVSYLTFYLFLWDLSSVYFLSMLFSRSFVPLPCYPCTFVPIPHLWRFLYIIIMLSMFLAVFAC